MHMQGDWFCPCCENKSRRKKTAGSAGGTAREHYLEGGEKLALVQIQVLWQEPDGSHWFTGRWYELPDKTHTGRQVNLSLTSADMQPVFEFVMMALLCLASL